MDRMQRVAYMGDTAPRYHAREWLDDMIFDGVGAASVAEWLAKSTGIGRGWFDNMTQRFGSLEAPSPIGDGALTPGFVIKTAFVGWTAGQASLAVEGSATLDSDFLQSSGTAVTLEFAKLADDDAQGLDAKVADIKAALMMELSNSATWAELEANDDFADSRARIEAAAVGALVAQLDSGFGEVSGPDVGSLIVGNGASSAINGGDADDVVFGRGGSDYVDSGAGNDLILGGDGADYLIASSGDTIDGGAGNDVLEFDGNAATFVFGRGSGHDVLSSWVFGGNWDTPPEVQIRLEGLSRGDVELVWELDYDMAGTDETENEQGFIPYWGGRDGFAALKIAETGDTLFLGRLAIGFKGWTTHENEYVYENDEFAGLVLGNFFYEVITGAAPEDWTPIDYDIFVFDNGSTASLTDLFDLRGMDSASLDPSWSSAQAEFEAGMAADSIQASGQSWVEGDDSGQRIFAYGSGSQVVGGGGDDSITTLGGDNWLDGGPGSDLLDGGAGRDTADYTNDPGPGGIIANLSGVAIVVGAETVQGGQVRDGAGGLDTLVSIEVIVGSAAADSLFGGEAADGFHGGDGADLILGHGGADEIAGHGGGDTLEGGAGADTMAFFAPEDAGDWLPDFTAQDDRIAVSAWAFGGGLTEGMDLTGWFLANGTGLADAEGHGQFVLRIAGPGEDGDELWWDADGIGTDAPVLLAHLPIASSITAADIAIIV